TGAAEKKKGRPADEHDHHRHDDGANSPPNMVCQFWLIGDRVRHGDHDTDADRRRQSRELGAARTRPTWSENLSIPATPLRPTHRNCSRIRHHGAPHEHYSRTLSDSAGDPIAHSGLWSLQFRDPASSFDPTAL